MISLFFWIVMILVDSIIIFEGRFTTLSTADEAFHSVMIDEPPMNWPRICPYFEIVDGMIRLTVRRKNGRYGMSLIIRKCARCHGRLCFRDIKDRHRSLSPGKFDELWSDPSRDILCDECIKIPRDDG